MKKNKLNKDILLLISILLIAFSTLILAVTVSAYTVEKQEGENEKLTIYKPDRRVTIDEGTYEYLIKNDPYGALANYGSVYCLKNGKALFSKGDTWSYYSRACDGKNLTDPSGACTGSNGHEFDLDKYIYLKDPDSEPQFINPSNGGSPSTYIPSGSTARFLNDHKEKGTATRFNKRSSIVYKITPVEHMNGVTIEGGKWSDNSSWGITCDGFGRYTGSLIPYVATFNDLHNSRSNIEGDTYHNDSQFAIWEKTGAMVPGTYTIYPIYKAGIACEAFEEQVKEHPGEPEVKIFSPNNEPAGTTLEILDGRKYFKVGPFEMSDYAYAASKHAEKYSGRDLEYRKDMLGGLTHGEVTLEDDSGATKVLSLDDLNSNDVKFSYIDIGDNNRSSSSITNNILREEGTNRQLNIEYKDVDNSLETIIDGKIVNLIPLDNNRFEVVYLEENTITYAYMDKGNETELLWGPPENYNLPFPNSKFYLLLSEEAVGTNTKVKEFGFEYRTTRADGKGWVANGKFARTFFDFTEQEGCDTYSPNPSSEAQCEGTVYFPNREGGYIPGKETDIIKHSYTLYCYNSDHNYGEMCTLPNCKEHTKHECNKYNHPEKHYKYYYHDLKGKTSTKQTYKHGNPYDGMKPEDVLKVNKCEEAYIEDDDLMYCGGHKEYYKTTYDTVYGCHCSCQRKHTRYWNTKVTYTCAAHGFRHCMHVNWKAETHGERPQPLLGVNDAKVEVKEKKIVKPLDIRLTTDLTINKYIVKAEHVITASGEAKLDAQLMSFNGNPNRDRSNTNYVTIEQKRNDPVKVERGDKITFNIDLLNAQAQAVKCKIVDILPPMDTVADVNFMILGNNNESDSITYIYGNNNIGNENLANNLDSKTEILVPEGTPDAPGKTTIQITLRPIKETGTYENFAKIITSNKGDFGHNKVSYDDASHPNNNGPVVNIAEDDPVYGNFKYFTPKYKIQKDADCYRIKEYNVNIDKYIYDINHNPLTKDISKLDTTYNGLDKRMHKNITEAQKEQYPEYAEYGDLVTYCVRVYNTTHEYDDSIDNSKEPYFSPDRIYVTVTDTLPDDCEIVKVNDEFIDYQNIQTVDTTKINLDGKTLKVEDFMIPANDSREFKVTVKVNNPKYGKDKVKINTAELGESIKNINRGTETNSNVDKKYCEIKNNSITTISKDYFALNNYDCFIDKYVSKYDEKVLIDDNSKFITTGGDVAQHGMTDSTHNDELLHSRATDESTEIKVNKDQIVEDIIKDRKGNEKFKLEHPLGVEKGEKITYTIKVINDADTINRGFNDFGNKPATQVRTTQIVDTMPKDIEPFNATATYVTADGKTSDVKILNMEEALKNFEIVKDDKQNEYKKYVFSLDNTYILNPKEYILINIDCDIKRNNLTLEPLPNDADLKVLTNINHTNDDPREVTEQNIAEVKNSKDYIKLKDLVISGHVWVDFNRNGLMDETNVNKHKQDLYSVTDTGLKENVKVELYRIEPGAENDDNAKLVRTTMTDKTGLYSFARDENLQYYDTEKYFEQYDSNKNYQRVDKANNKDANGNYTEQSELYKYYIEYVYDGLTYRSTEIYAGKDNVNEDGTLKDIKVNDKKKYEIDSNAAEFIDLREEFNKKYEYISYNSAYNTELDKSADLKFMKEINGEEAHKSELLEDKSRAMRSRSFIKNDSRFADEPNTDYLWLALPENYPDNTTLPGTEYTKDINLGLELREDVDLALSKDVYDVKTTVDGEEMNYLMNKNSVINGSGLKDYIIDKPYGLELYESDYKYRVDQYKSDIVKAYKGLNGESELNVQVTYKIRLDNVSTTDDDEVTGAKDKKLDVKISEILDLYDENFIELKFDDKGEATYDLNKVSIKVKDANGHLTDGHLASAEAWYYEKDDKGEYIIANIGDIEKAKAEKKEPEGAIYIKASPEDLKEYSKARYKKVDLKFVNKSSRMVDGVNKGKFSEKANDFKANGYNTVYIQGMNEMIIPEGEHLDIYTKYVLDKDSMKIYVDKQAYDETKTNTVNTENKVENDNVTITVDETKVVSTTKYEGTIKRALKIIDRIAKPKETRRGLENIAQINAYSVYYPLENNVRKPAALVDKDSNVGNIGVKDTDGHMTDCDDIKFYEDTAYKTGIVMAADGTEQSRKTVNELYEEKLFIIEVENEQEVLTERKISGMVWDDSRSDKLKEQDNKDSDPTQYVGNGKYAESDKADEKAKINDNVRVNYHLDEKDKETIENKDLKVRNAKAEFIEIVEIPESVVPSKLQELKANSDSTEKAKEEIPVRYYEEVLSNVTWPQVRNARTSNEGMYYLKGMVPGKYVVRFTYGDTVDENKDKEPTKYDKEIIAQKDMLVFNGQDYKSTKYNINVSSDEKDVDKLILQLEASGVSDARDDEIRRLEVNAFSEVMTNYKAELIKGIANGSKDIKGADGKIAKLTANAEPNTNSMLKEFTDKTYMNSETPEFLIKAEKLPTEEKTTEYLRIQKSWKTGEPLEKIKLTPEELKEIIYYKELNKLNEADKDNRKFQINNVDLGITYRPESQISLIKKINEIKLTTQDGKVLIKLLFNTEDDMTRTIDTEHSIGLELVQFVSNKYKGIYDELFNEEVQGFVYLQVDDQILHGSKISIKYDFDAVNDSEIDRISNNLNAIRYKENAATKALIKKLGKDIIDTDYTASGTGRNVIYKDTYKLDEHNSLYRNKAKTMSTDGNDGYYGRYVAESYYTNVNNPARDMISPLKFDKILDFVDVDLDFESKTNKDELLNNYWALKQSKELVNYLSIYKKTRDVSENVTTSEPLLNPEKIKYNTLVVSIDDCISDEQRVDHPEEINNIELSKFLKPMKESKDEAIGKISLELSKVLAQESDTKNMSYENLAEIVQFTTLTGRRTNFATTIGNADVNKVDEDDKNKGTAEFVTAMYESDTAATETVTLTPPTGLMKNRQMIVNTVETAKVSVTVIVIALAVAIVTIFVIKLTYTKIKGKRYK